jgi:DNA-binding MarR family transcriptional regulator
VDRAGNLLGALATAIGDRTGAAVTAAAGGADSAAAALSALLHFLDRPTVDQLRRVLGLTSSGTVRLVDRLAAAGYVERGGGTDGRATTVALTPEGRQVARGVAAARADVLEAALGVLTAPERAAFEALAGRVLVGLIREPGATRWTCRLCDTGVCGRDRGECPVGNAAMARWQARQAPGTAFDEVGPAGSE